MSLRSNNIKEEGLLVLGESLIQNRTLKSLALFGNGFTHNTGALFSELDNLRSLNLSIDIQVYNVDDEFMTAETDELKEYK